EGMAWAGANAHREHRPAAFLTGDRYDAAMQTRQFLDECQSDARPLMRSGPCVLHAVKALEHARKGGFRGADASIGHSQLDAIAAGTEVHSNPTFERELESVREK